MSQDKPRIRLDEVTLMRCILAILIVFMHSFTCYNGSWSEPAGYVDVPIYKWLQRISFAFTLEAFVFISGYLYAFQRITLNRTSSFWSLTKGKLKRLYLPSVIFSILYFVIFYEYKGVASCGYSILNGCGHMWYLPMLFWCFIGCWMLLKIKVRDVYKIAFLIVLNLLSFDVLPLRLSNACQFLFYFYCGYAVFAHRDQLARYVTKKKAVVSWIIFIVAFVVCRPLRDYFTRNEGMGTVQMVLLSAANKACQLAYAAAGVWAFYSACVLYTSKKTISKVTVGLAGTSFGIYIFQQFTLQVLYYKTTLPIAVGPYWLPWVGFAVAMALSWVLSYLLLKTKTGKFLIG